MGGKPVVCGNIRRRSAARVVRRGSVEGQQAEKVGAVGEAVGGQPLAVLGGQADPRPHQVEAPDISGLDFESVHARDGYGFFDGPVGRLDAGGDVHLAVPTGRVVARGAVLLQVEGGAGGVGDQLVKTALVHIGIEENFDAVGQQRLRLGEIRERIKQD